MYKCLFAPLFCIFITAFSTNNYDYLISVRAEVNHGYSERHPEENSKTLIWVDETENNWIIRGFREANSSDYVLYGDQNAKFIEFYIAPLSDNSPMLKTALLEDLDEWGMQIVDTYSVDDFCNRVYSTYLVSPKVALINNLRSQYEYRLNEKKVCLLEVYDTRIISYPPRGNDQKLSFIPDNTQNEAHSTIKHHKSSSFIPDNTQNEAHSTIKHHKSSLDKDIFSAVFTIVVICLIVVFVTSTKNEKLKDHYNSVRDKYPDGVREWRNKTHLSDKEAYRLVDGSIDDIKSLDSAAKERMRIIKAELERCQREEEERQRLNSLCRNLKAEASAIQQYLRDSGVSYFYHFTDRRNLASIREHGGLLSWKYCEDHRIAIPYSGGSDFSRSLDRSHGLSDYVRLSFCDDHPMAFRLKKKGYDLVLLKIKVDVASIDTTLFSNMNATDSNHHHDGRLADLQQVDISATRADYLSSSDPRFKPHQAEVLVKTFVPLKFIVNIDDPDDMR